MWMGWVGLGEVLILVLPVLWTVLARCRIVWIIVATLVVLISKMLTVIRINLRFLLKLGSRVRINPILGFPVGHSEEKKLGWCSQSKISNNHKINKIITLVNNSAKIKKKLVTEYQRKPSCPIYNDSSKCLAIIKAK